MVNKVIQRNIRISHRKAQLVCDLIRNLPVKEAIVILKNTNKKIAPIILKLLNSAIANATNNHAMNAEKLYVYNIFANQGPTMKRTMPRARGSADMIRKRSTHIEIHLSDNPMERMLEIEKIKERKHKAALANKGGDKGTRVKTKPVKEEKPKPQPKPQPKPEAKKPDPKPKMVNGISVEQKHTVVTEKEVSNYDYEQRLKDWRKKAGYNEKPHKCVKCKDDNCHTSILLESGRHICYTCWIKKPENSK